MTLGQKIPFPTFIILFPDLIFYDFGNNIMNYRSMLESILKMQICITSLK